MAPQFEYIRKSVLAFNLPSVDLPNYEADDLIATYVEKILKNPKNPYTKNLLSAVPRIELQSNLL